MMPTFPRSPLSVGSLQLLSMSLLPCCRFHPAEVEMPHRSDFGIPYCLRPTEAGSALGSTPFEATFTFTVVTARQLVVSPRETLSIGFRILISLHPAIQNYGAPDFVPRQVYLPAEHTRVLTGRTSVRRSFPSTAGRLAFKARPSRRITPGLSLLPAYADRRPVCFRPSCTSWPLR